MKLFQDWLVDVCTGSHTSDEREGLLKAWEEAPHARYCHPREEHLLPLMVCQGAAGAPGELVFDDFILEKGLWLLNGRVTGIIFVLYKYAILLT